jgi:hypothetical protein
VTYRPEALPARVAEKVRIDPLSGCWTWIASTTTNGYGQIKDGPNRTVRSHRLVYEALVGSIPTGLFCDHLCGNRRCVNPAHIELVTNAENIRRGSERRTHCKHGHALTGGNVRITKTKKALERICNACRAMYKRRARLKKKSTPTPHSPTDSIDSPQPPL